jgi:ribosomal protein L31E
VPSGKITIWRERAISLRAAAVMRASAVTRAPRSIGIIRALVASQPNNGSHINSRLRI